ncbi:MAG TPA: zinc ribbon domain-containing protein [Terriglobales bacterium]|nr:zinc ribbon domain-containing protein [Terriglobales bacterium]
MPIKNETSTRFADEVRIISRWVWAVAALGYVVPVAALLFARHTEMSGDPFFRLAILIPLVILGGTLVASAILLIGYIYKDAGRRGMSPVLWTLLATFIPHALGIVLYFVLRKPRTLNCPQCGTIVQPGFGFCPKCQCRLNAICPQCQRGVSPADKFCPYCGRDIGSSANPSSAPVPSES